MLSKEWWMMKRNYVFPAIIERDKTSGKYTVVFPDLPGCAIEGEDFIQAYYWAGPRLGFHLYMMDRDYEHIPDASDTSNWEIAADAVVVQVAANLQEYQRMYGPKFARKAIGFPSWLFQLGKKGRPISAQEIREVLREKLGIDTLPENSQ
ncbi:type II toxin-antitoxin system HicB family antitoxin [Desulfosporosinus orientis]|nr:type II toxin-antitoxin system HicB family antitoxin [Desulfosporosinus orientis]